MSYPYVTVLLAVCLWLPPVLASADAPDELARIRATLEKIEAYEVTFTKEERVGKKVHAPQPIALRVRAAPFAVFARWKAGPHEGRRILYDTTTRAGQFRVREAGFAARFGAMWIALDSSLTRRESNHPVSRFGYGGFLSLVERDVADAAAFGGHTRIDEEAGADGGRCMTWVAPATARGLYAERARICLDGETGLPTLVEVHDRNGLLDRLAYSDFVAREAATIQLEQP